MAPNNYATGLPPSPDCETATEQKTKTDVETDEDFLPQSKPTDERPDRELIWLNIISIFIIHVIAVYALIYVSPQVTLYTWIWGFTIGGIQGFGVTAGAHRLWAHRSYKAKWPLRVLLLAAYSVAGQNTLHEWVRDHRVHHKFSETDADPHNANRGFFFSHVGWLFQRKHPMVLKKGKNVDMSDLHADPLVRFHTKYFSPIKFVMCFVIPCIVPWYFWAESVRVSILGMGCFRYVVSLNITWLVNSAAHIWGNKPFDGRIGASDNKTIAMIAMGEGWHNYHHVFPWDYKAAELGNYWGNTTTMWLDLFGKIGWAYDFKSPSKELIEHVSRKYGAKSNNQNIHDHLPEVDDQGRALDEEKVKLS